VADEKPSDAFLGVMDFFSSVVPGAVAAFFLLNEDKSTGSITERVADHVGVG
jgi:hypothetical protein